MGVGLKVLRLAGHPPPLEQRRRGVEDEDAGGVHLGLEPLERGVLQDSGRGSAL